MSSACAAVEHLQQNGGSWSQSSSQLISPPTGPPLTSSTAHTRRISLTLVRIVLGIYNEKLYGIWPMLSADDLIQQLQNNPDDVETYALATALCGATLSHLNQTITHESLTEALTAHSFAREARRVRSMFDYMEPVSLNTVLTSYFLHIYYGRQASREQTAAFYIREAISFAQLIDMHTEDSYYQYSLKEQKVMRKLYFLLFMTERYLCIQYGLPTILEPISLPTMDHEDVPDVVSGFLNLVNLFSTPGNDFFSKWTAQSSNVSISSKQLLLIQRELQLPTETPTGTNDIQKVDIYATQHWIRSLAWKLSIQLGYIIPGGRREMSVAYPHKIAQDALSEVGHIHPHAFEVHGPGMEVKMHEIASALADSILCQPQEEPTPSFVVRPRDTLKSLCDLIFSTEVMLPDLRDSLTQKLQVILGRNRFPPAIDVTDCGFEDMIGSALVDPEIDDEGSIDESTMIPTTTTAESIPVSLSPSTIFQSLTGYADIPPLPGIMEEDKYMPSMTV
jgi:hypothetical protein